MRMWPTTPSRC
ncbi:hypothetical protein LINPERHAP1_LOCUS21684 [Linum perenne]